MWTYIVVALIIVLVFGYIYSIDPVTLFGDTGTLGTIPVIVTYLITNLALPVYMLKHHREDFSPIKHLIIPLLGTAFMLFPLWGLVQPGQPYPFSLYPKLALALLVFSLIYGAILARRNPDLVQRIGSYVADEEY